ncbi:hypothetical protein OSB04_018942 [Centaurea solstitialis]|uniref:Uncharacterized protein n=1 Tax=Centaurea solstitialis TaxID=347529 RepID=A0AA38SQZ0_9ASTR|nr:hypothetical protein OSB04_018942 [Centaurea solstitialis]
MSFNDEYDEWQSRVVEENQQLDRIIDDIVINSSNLFINDQPPRARRKYRDRQREIGEARLMEDYFIDNPTYDADMFRRRFRMQRSLFLRIVDAVTANDEYFQQRPDGAADAVDEYLRMGASTTREALMHFIDGVISCFGDEYLRKPNEADLARLLYVGDQRGFPGQSPKVSYVVNGHEYDKTYYLTDGIYPLWAAFVKSITSPQIQKHKLATLKPSRHRQNIAGNSPDRCCSHPTFCRRRRTVCRRRRTATAVAGLPLLPDCRRRNLSRRRRNSRRRNPSRRRGPLPSPESAADASLAGTLAGICCCRLCSPESAAAASCSPEP